jgi:rubrerythrin
MVTDIKNKSRAAKAKLPDKKVNASGATKMRITREDYLELADLANIKAKKYKPLSENNARYSLLAAKCKAKADQMSKDKKAKKGPSKQKKKAERWHCMNCNVKFDKPIGRKHCPTCDSVDIEQMKITSFTAKPELEPGESSTTDEDIELEAEVPAV